MRFLSPFFLKKTAAFSFGKGRDPVPSEMRREELQVFFYFLLSFQFTLSGDPFLAEAGFFCFDWRKRLFFLCFADALFPCASGADPFPYAFFVKGPQNKTSLPPHVLGDPSCQERTDFINYTQF